MKWNKRLGYSIRKSITHQSKIPFCFGNVTSDLLKKSCICEQFVQLFTNKLKIKYAFTNCVYLRFSFFFFLQSGSGIYRTNYYEILNQKPRHSPKAQIDQINLMKPVPVMCKHLQLFECILLFLVSRNVSDSIWN